MTLFFRIKSPDPPPPLKLKSQLKLKITENLAQDVELSLAPENEIIIPKPKTPSPVMLKMKENYRDQIKFLSRKFLDINSKTTGEYIKLHVNTDEGILRNLNHVLEENSDFE
ncbi:hypothetical protein TNCV_4960121 [Trichonephila clavipes]|uniref:Uncharacterized protein n=1 Tax=Trichonephila clavipes TaxID=2585209 RepID=A0A8X6VCT8_TRICX|nr:hypothetical protein TNCV_4960121 [Trichonephila clavipes]